MLYYITYTHIPSKKAFGYAIAKMCSVLADHVPVTLIIPRGREREIAEDIFSHYNLARNFTVKELPCFDLFRFKFLGRRIPFIIRRFTFAVSVLFGVGLGEKDICYSRDLWSLVLMRLKTANLFLEIHYLSRLDAFFVRLIHFARKIVVITSFLKDELVSSGYKREDVLVAPSGFDAAEFSLMKESKDELRKRLNFPRDKKIILYSGNLFAWKGVYTLVDAFEHVKEDAILVFVGGSEDAIFDFKEYVLGKSYAGRMIILGHKNHKEIAAYLKAADILVIPNSAKKKISKYNTSPIKLFEYMASGVPIVASDLPSIREVLSNSDATFAEADDPNSLARAISNVILNYNEYLNKARQAMNDVRKYDWSKRADNILDFIK